MADNGINWGGILTTGAVLTGCALVAPCVLDSFADATIGTTAADTVLKDTASTFFDKAGAYASQAAQYLNTQYASVASSAGLGSYDFTTMLGSDKVNGVVDAVKDAGLKSIDWVASNPGKVAATAVAGAALGQWTSKVAATGSRPSTPGGTTYADMVRARQRAATMAAPTRTA